MSEHKNTLDFERKMEMEVSKVPIVRKIQLVKEFEEILKLLPVGMSIPLWPEFTKYILFDLRHFNARSLVLIEDGSSVGHVLVFYADKKILYFGFFGVSNDRKERIEFLIESLIEYARNNGFETLKGPVNVPTIIYGWGFMEQGSSSTQIVHKPVNSPIYPETFRQKGFKQALQEQSFEGTFDNSSFDYTEGFNYDGYELVVFDTWEELANVKKEFLKLNVKNLAPTSVVTPGSAVVFDNYLEFIKQYGDPSTIVFTRHKTTNKFIGCLVATPNPFDKSSCLFFTIAVNKRHRKKGLGWWMMKELITNCIKLGINSCIVIVESRVEGGRSICERLGFNVMRTHTVFTYSLKNNQNVSIEDRLERVTELLSEKKDEKAFELVNKLLESEPENDRGWLLLGIAYRRSGKLNDAVKCFHEATRLNSSMEEAWGLLTITYLDKHQEKKAEECLLNAVVKNPSSEELKFYEQNLIRIYKTFGPFF